MIFKTFNPDRKADVSQLEQFTAIKHAPQSASEDDTCFGKTSQNSINGTAKLQERTSGEGRITNNKANTSV